jgi:HprK-related kinase B
LTEPGLTRSISALSVELERQYAPREQLRLELDGCSIQVRSNSAPLLDALRDYFGDLAQSASWPDRGPAATSAASAEVVLQAIEAAPCDFGFVFRAWPREAGKPEQKEQFCDLKDGRVVLKVRTRLQFLIGRQELLAVGPCLANSNQIINFINSQCISRRLHEGWSLCHAAGVAQPGPRGARGIGIAARAGAGKSTLALHLMSSGLSFVSNDRLLIKDTGRGPALVGIPKMPRVNPGTLLNNPDLRGILSDERQRQLAPLSREQIWNLEEKYDVLVDRIYGKGRIVYRADLAGLMILNWNWHGASVPTRFEAVDLAARPDLLELIMKSPGVFHRDHAGRRAVETARPDPAAYLDATRRTPVWEATGRPEFELGVSFCRRLLEV